MLDERFVLSPLLLIRRRSCCSWSRERRFRLLIGTLVAVVLGLFVQPFEPHEHGRLLLSVLYGGSIDVVSATGAEHGVQRENTAQIVQDLLDGRGGMKSRWARSR